MGWKEIALVTGFVAAWFALNRWVLPWFGIPTCCSGICGMPPLAGPVVLAGVNRELSHGGARATLGDTGSARAGAPGACRCAGRDCFPNTK